MMIAALNLLAMLVLGAWLAATFDRMAPALWGGRARGPLAALADGAAMLTRPATGTEKPDAMLRIGAPLLYLVLAAVGLAVVPIGPAGALIESPVGIVIWGSCEALIVIAVFMHGWAPNSPFPLIGAYRYAAIALPVMLPSMFVLIAAAIPAESLSVTAIVESQREVWNVVRQPLGLPLFVLVGLTLTLRGPMDYADGLDLAGGTSAEQGGRGRALWQMARLAMLVAFSGMAAAVFLGGPLGPVLPGPVWLWLKTALIMAVVVVLGQAVGRTPPANMLKLLWVFGLPISFLHLVAAGALALW